MWTTSVYGQMNWLQCKIHLIHFLPSTDHLHLIKVPLKPVRPPSRLRLPDPEPGQHLAPGLNLLPERRQPGVPAPEVAGRPLQPLRVFDLMFGLKQRDTGIIKYLFNNRWLRISFRISLSVLSFVFLTHFRHHQLQRDGGAQAEQA